jgi:protein TonB
MKTFKKRPSKQLEKFSTVFTQLGLVLVLFIVYVTLEHETEEKQIAIVNYDTTERIYVTDEQQVIYVKEPKAIEPTIDLRTTEPKIIDKFKKGDDEIIKTLFTEPKKVATVFVDANTLVVIDEPKNDIDEDVPFLLIEDAPIFKGCEGLSKKENKVCFEEQMRKFVQKNFDGQLAQELGLSRGKKKIQTQFVIDKNGNIIDVQVKAPHPKLQEEAKRIIDKLPKFTPGKQRGNPVKVKYTLPISFQVE